MVIHIKQSTPTIDGKIDNRLEILQLLKDPNSDPVGATYDKYENKDWLLEDDEEHNAHPFYNSLDVALMTVDRQTSIQELEAELTSSGIELKRKTPDEISQNNVKKTKRITDYSPLSPPKIKRLIYPISQSPNTIDPQMTLSTHDVSTVNLQSSDSATVILTDSSRERGIPNGSISL
jgi:hypothetical protein